MNFIGIKINIFTAIILILSSVLTLTPFSSIAIAVLASLKLK